MDASGKVFVVDQATNALKEILAAGGYMTVNTLAVANGNFNEPSKVAVDGSGNVFVTNFGTSAVKEVLAPGYTAVAIPGTGFARLLSPTGAPCTTSTAPAACTSPICAREQNLPFVSLPVLWPKAPKRAWQQAVRVLRGT